jgi:hypothetical protein
MPRMRVKRPAFRAPPFENQIHPPRKVCQRFNYRETFHPLLDSKVQASPSKIEREGALTKVL